MKVLITGSEGFIAQNLIRILIKNKIQVFGINKSKKKSKINYFCIHHNLLKSIDFKKINLADIDFIIHLAGVTEHNKIVKSEEFINDTKKILKNTLTIANKLNCKYFIYASSGKVYKRTNKIITTRTKIRPDSILGKAKVIAENIIVNSNIFKKNKIKILRIFNVYGKNQSQQFLVPNILKQIKDIKKKKQGRIELGNLDVKRDFIYIDDLSKIILKIIKSPGEFKMITNISSGYSINPKYIAKKLLKANKIECDIISKRSKIREETKNEVVYQKNKKSNFLKNVKNLV